MSGLFDFLLDSGSYEDRKVARDDIGELSVSTARVSDGRQPFETAVEHPLYNGGAWVIVEAYDSKEAATKGHEKWLKLMTAKELPAELKDCCNSHIAEFAESIGGSERFVFKREVIH